MKLSFFLFIGFVIIQPIQGQAVGKMKEKTVNDSTFVVISQIVIAGNTKTKEKVITRELLFKQGDTIFTNRLDDIIKKSNDNLYNTSLFNFIHINILHETETYIKIYVVVEERWYLWPYLILEQADRNLSSFFHEKDWSRINYGLMMVKYNFRGRRETLKMKVRLGYKEQYQVFYQIPFFLNHPKHGIAVEANWFRQKEVQYATLFDEPYLHKDYTTYGLKNQYTSVGYSFRKAHYLRHNFNIGFTYSTIVDTIAILNPDFYGSGKTKNQYFSLGYEYDFDKRNYRHYPLSGYNFDFYASLKGLGFLAGEMPTFWETQTTANLFVDFGNRWYTGFGTKVKISQPKKQHYAIEQALGYGDVLRSYEYYIIDGQQFVTGRAFIKYAIIPFTVKQIESFGWDKFNKIHYSVFANAFIDQGYVRDMKPHPTNTLPNSYLVSFGLGIDLVAYYDQIIRFEYSMNRIGEHGFFINIGKAF